jgi:hypothetical protein
MPWRVDLLQIANYEIPSVGYINLLVTWTDNKQTNTQQIHEDERKFKKEKKRKRTRGRRKKLNEISPKRFYVLPDERLTTTQISHAKAGALKQETSEDTIFTSDGDGVMRES